VSIVSIITTEIIICITIFFSSGELYKYIVLLLETPICCIFPQESYMSKVV
jgi:hypothetical protein